MHDQPNSGTAPHASPGLAEIEAARARIRGRARRTPVLTCSALDELAGARLFFKCENFQKVGAFKFRGACNAVFSLSDDEARAGVVTHSSGNHAQALALAARMRGIPARIVMPTNAPEVKRAAVAGYGAEIVPCEPTVEAREAATAELLRARGGTLIHPYDDARVIAGQATAALELFEEVVALDAIVAPVGGGGLLSGTALAASYVSPGTRVFGAEPTGADDARRSLEAGRVLPSVDPKTICDGLRTSLGRLTFPILREHVAGIALADDLATARAMRLIWERMKIVVEPSAAIALAVVLERRVGGAPGDLGPDARVGIVLSGGNVDFAGNLSC